MRLQLDLVDEVRATMEQRLARYQDHMAKHYSCRVRHIDFQVRGLVLRKVMGVTKDPTHNWDVRTYVFHMLGTYVTILCNWLIL